MINFSGNDAVRSTRESLNMIMSRNSPNITKLLLAFLASSSNDVQIPVNSVAPCDLAVLVLQKRQESSNQIKPPPLLQTGHGAREMTRTGILHAL